MRCRKERLGSHYSPPAYSLNRITFSNPLQLQSNADNLSFLHGFHWILWFLPAVRRIHLVATRRACSIIITSKYFVTCLYLLEPISSFEMKIRYRTDCSFVLIWAVKIVPFCAEASFLTSATFFVVEDLEYSF